MPTYVRAAGGHVAERVRPEPGSDDESRYDHLAADPASGWRVEDAERAETLAPSRARARKRPSPGKE